MSPCCEVRNDPLIELKDEAKDLVGDWPPNDPMEVMTVEDGADSILAEHRAKMKRD